MPARYCTENDVLIGDVGLPAGEADRYVNLAADEIDSDLGREYVMPVTEGAVSTSVWMLLKRINILIASGRLILSKATASEDGGEHAYGRSLLKEGQGIIKAILAGQIDLVGVARVAGTDDGNGPVINQQDATSAVDTFYGYVGQRGDLWRPG